VPCHEAQTRGEALTRNCAKSAQIPTSPRTGRGKAARLSLNLEGDPASAPFRPLTPRQPPAPRQAARL